MEMRMITIWHILTRLSVGFSDLKCLFFWVIWRTEMYIMVWPGTFKWYLSSITTVVLYTFRLLFEGGSLCTFGGCSIYNITVQDSTDFFIECIIWNNFAIATVAIFTLYRHTPLSCFLKCILMWLNTTDFQKWDAEMCREGTWISVVPDSALNYCYLPEYGILISAHCTKCLRTYNPHGGMVVDCVWWRTKTEHLTVPRHDGDRRKQKE